MRDYPTLHLLYTHVHANGNKGKALPLPFHNSSLHTPQIFNN